ncbi:MAG TPA: MBL fold metallo-hydrolase [Thermoanaerobaculia bacterium]|nr:MBL fold metallo-hydrolase [Thermoanaerobaculia bacterium]
MRPSLFELALLLPTLAAALGCAERVPDIAAATAAAPPASSATLEEVDGTLRSETHVLEELAPGVYFATGTGAVNVASNALVVVNEEDVLVVDSHITPDAARTLIDTVRALTGKPLRYLVNSHFHFDHAHGNQAFPEGIEIIGHEYTRERLLGDVLSEPTYRRLGSPDVVAPQIAALEERLPTAGEEERPRLEAQLAMQRRHLAALDEIDPTPPNVTLTEKMTLHRGDREIQILHLGRGHTGGDLVVFLPAERIAFTGDLFYPGAQYLGDGYPRELIATLEAIATLDADVLVGGHGPPVRDRAVLERSKQYLRQYWDQVAGFHARGLTVDEAIAEVDFDGWEDWAGFQLTFPAVLRLEVARMYELLEGAD